MDPSSKHLALPSHVLFFLDLFQSQWITFFCLFILALARNPAMMQQLRRQIESQFGHEVSDEHIMMALNAHHFQGGGMGQAYLDEDEAFNRAIEESKLYALQHDPPPEQPVVSADGVISAGPEGAFDISSGSGATTSEVSSISSGGGNEASGSGGGQAAHFSAPTTPRPPPVSAPTTAGQGGGQKNAAAADFVTTPSTHPQSPPSAGRSQGSLTPPPGDTEISPEASVTVLFRSVFNRPTDKEPVTQKYCTQSFNDDGQKDGFDCVQDLLDLAQDYKDDKDAFSQQLNDSFGIDKVGHRRRIMSALKALAEADGGSLQW